MMICRHVPCDKPLGVMRFEHENPMRSNNSKPNRNFVEMVRGNYIDYILKVVKKNKKNTKRAPEHHLSKFETVSNCECNANFLTIRGSLISWLIFEKKPFGFGS